MELLNLYGCMMIFGMGCTVGAVFILCVLNETSGLPLDELDLNDESDTDASSNLDQRPLVSIEHQIVCYRTFNNN